MKHVIIRGDYSEGFRCFGPFENHTLAANYAKQMPDPDMWRVIVLGSWTKCESCGAIEVDYVTTHDPACPVLRKWDHG